ncbi:hypothetical protein F0562_033261 [Nyssa sinensis]|uniref:Uncharacterized protein n=1 Tax=Nyssa sinensis TaxID=561372 RepID=A0A5J5ATL5_9ASTE|nr:hypothetical protein F0562_033261 [Nyssa sinensis]
MDFQQPPRYMRPPLHPPPSMADPHHQPQPRQPVHPQAPWFSGQFQYHHPSQHSPSPPPPHQQWAPPPHSDHLPPPPPPYPAPHHPPYPAHPLHNQYSLPPPPHLPPPHHPHSQIPQSYNQDWANPNWGHHQGRDYPAHNNEEDWAAKARAWAAAKAATDNQHPQSQFTPVGRPEEQSHYHDQYPQTIDPHYADVLQPSLPVSSYHQYPAAAAPPYGPPVVYPQESAFVISAQSSYVPDGYLSYAARDGNLAGDSNAAFPHQESSSTSPVVRQQEVPSSYSSVTGKEEADDQNEKFYKSLPLPIASTQGQHHSHHPLPAVGRSVLMEQTHYAFGNQSAEPTTGLSDQPLDFAPRFSRDHDPHMQSNYTHNDSGGPVRGVDPVAAVPSIHTWASPVAPGVVYPPIPPVLPSGPQHDPSAGLPSPVHAHSAPMFGRMPGPNFQPTIPSVGAPFGIGTGTALLPTTAFPGDVYGVSSVPEQPKKASVPNWLREEIIKKAVIASSAPEHPKEGTQSIEDEGDYVEAARTAAINQEIKRVLTEVLLKVTDELFDEIATKVLSEDDLTVEVAVDPNAVASNHIVSPSTPTVPTPKASAKVLISAKAKENDTENSSGVPNSEENTVHKRPIIRKLSEDIHTAENDSSQAETEGHRKSYTNVESNPSSWSPDKATIYHGAVINELSNNLAGRESAHGNVGSRYSFKMVSGVGEDETNVDGKKILDGFDAFKSKESVGEKEVKTEVPVESVHANKSMTDNSHGRETRNKPDKNDRHETNRSSARKNLVKEVESGKNGTDEKGDGNRRRQDEKHVRKERPDDLNGSKERMKEQGVKSGEKVKESDSRKKSSHPDVKGDGKETERDRGANAKQNSSRKKERAKDETGERSRHKLTGELNRHKRRRSSSVGSRGRNSKDNSAVSHADDSSDEASDDSKRKLHSKKRNSSPSPIRSRRRQVSRSPHSKHSHRRHSPYSSLESTRGRRSRSRSPVRRQR